MKNPLILVDGCNIHRLRYRRPQILVDYKDGTFGIFTSSTENCMSLCAYVWIIYTSLKYFVTSTKSIASLTYCDATHKMHLKYRNTI